MVVEVREDLALRRIVQREVLRAWHARARVRGRVARISALRWALSRWRALLWRRDALEAHFRAWIERCRATAHIVAAFRKRWRLRHLARWVAMWRAWRLQLRQLQAGLWQRRSLLRLLMRRGFVKWKAATAKGPLDALAALLRAKVLRRSLATLWRNTRKYQRLPCVYINENFRAFENPPISGSGSVSRRSGKRGSKAKAKVPGVTVRKPRNLRFHDDPRDVLHSRLHDSFELLARARGTSTTVRPSNQSQQRFALWADDEIILTNSFQQGRRTTKSYWI